MHPTLSPLHAEAALASTHAADHVRPDFHPCLATAAGGRGSRTGAAGRRWRLSCPSWAASWAAMLQRSRPPPRTPGRHEAADPSGRHWLCSVLVQASGCCASGVAPDQGHVRPAPRQLRRHPFNMHALRPPRPLVDLRDRPVHNWYFSLSLSDGPLVSVVRVSGSRACSPQSTYTAGCL